MSERIAQVRLVGAVFEHRLGIGDARPGAGAHGPLALEQIEDAVDHGLERREDVLLRDEAHLDVELIELARKAVRARVLVAKAGRDLEIAVEARHHQKLLILLRRLRQRVELAGVNARGHEEVARAFGRRGGENRRLELEKALRLHASAQLVDHSPTQHDVGVKLLAAQIEKAVFEPRLFRIGLIAEDGQRQLGGRAQHLDLAHIDFDGASRHLGVLGSGRALAHFAVEARHPLRTQLLGLREGGESGSTTHCVMP